MERKPISLKIDQNLWQKVLKHCQNEQRDVSEYVEEVLTRDLIQTIIPPSEKVRR